MLWGGLPLCIGSLPHKDPAKAVDLVLRHLKTIPFWPQLPALSFYENMYAQYSFRLPGVRVDPEARRITVDIGSMDPSRFYEAVVSDDVSYFEHPKDRFHGLYEFLSRALPVGTAAIKGQVTGPISLGLQVFDQNGKSVIYDEMYSEIVRHDVNLCLRWQESKLKERFANTIIFVDEPSLSLVGTPFATISPDQVRTWIDESIDGLKGNKGLHCCGNTDWSTVLGTGIDILSFDAYDYGHTISLYPSDVISFLDRGGNIAWGIVPNREETLRQETLGSLLERLDKAMEKLASKGIPKKRIVEASLITPQCGLEGLDEATSEEAIRMLVALSDEFRKRNGLERS